MNASGAFSSPSTTSSPTSVNRLPLDIVVRDGKVFVNGAQVVTADLVATNGVIHVIYAVLLPTAAPVGNHRGSLNTLCSRGGHWASRESTVCPSNRITPCYDRP